MPPSSVAKLKALRVPPENDGDVIVRIVAT
jgi:hypothetical protein